MADATVKFETDVEDKATKKLDSLSGTLKKIGALVIAAFAVDKVLDFAGASLQAYQEGERVATQLKNAVSNAKALGEGYEKSAEGIQHVTQELLDYSSALQQSTAYDDEAIAAAETRLLQSGLTVDSIKTLLPALMDQVSATTDLANADAELEAKAFMLGKALSGQSDSLTKMNIPLTEAEEKQFKLMGTQERAAFVSQKLSEQYSGAAENMRNTTEGSIKAMNEQWGNFQQQIGGLLAPIVEKLVSWSLEILTGIQKFVADLTVLWESNWLGIRTTVEGIITWFQKEFLPAFEAWVTDVKETFAPIVQFFEEHWFEIKEIWNIALEGISVLWSTFWAGIKAAFSIAWELIKGAIKLALAVLSGDWETAWNVIKETFEGVWQAIQKFVDQVIDAIYKNIKGSWDDIGAALESFKKTVTATWENLWNGLKGVVQSVVNWVVDQVNRIVKSIQGAFDYLNQLARQASSFGGGVTGMAMAATSNAVSGKKASGGRVEAGRSYLIGEAGPERFTPAINGTITPNKGIAPTVVFNFYGPVSNKEVAMEYADFVIRQLKLSNAVV